MIYKFHVNPFLIIKSRLSESRSKRCFWHMPIISADEREKGESWRGQRLNARSDVDLRTVALNLMEYR